MNHATLRASVAVACRLRAEYKVRKVRMLKQAALPRDILEVNSSAFREKLL